MQNVRATVLTMSFIIMWPKEHCSSDSADLTLSVVKLLRTKRIYFFINIQGHNEYVLTY